MKLVSGSVEVGRNIVVRAELGYCKSFSATVLSIYNDRAKILIRMPRTNVIDYVDLSVKDSSDTIPEKKGYVKPDAIKFDLPSYEEISGYSAEKDGDSWKLVLNTKGKLSIVDKRFKSKTKAEEYAVTHFCIK